MPAIEVPAEVPCPSASEVSPVERRLISDLTYTARTIERDERQYQTLSFVFSAEQAAAFRLWWRNDLYHGGAWFSAPATWPTPAGLVVKVRRFISAPNWSYASVGYWRVSIDCEVRGESELPSTPPDPLTLIFDHIGAYEDYTVPSGYRSAEIHMVGAGSGLGQNASRGAGGGYSTRTVSVSGGQTLRVYVGGRGANATTTRQGAGGGGGSAVVRSGAPLIVAGGGGGAGSGGATNIYPGGAGGGLVGETAPQERNLSGGGGTQTEPGVAPTGQPSQRFTGSTGDGQNGGPGANIGGALTPLALGGFGFGNGGDGASHSLDGGSGGGGGGYYGGASGSGDDGGAGGGGGSGYAPGGTTTTGSGPSVGANTEDLLDGFGAGAVHPGGSATHGRVVIYMS